MFNLYPYLNVNDLNLDWIIGHFKEFIDEISSLEDWRRTHEEEYRELKELYDAIVSGNFPPSMLNEMRNWFERNALELVANMLRFISIGINDNGYFIINIPSNWREIEFNTTELDIFTPLQSEYGHLVISY